MAAGGVWGVKNGVMELEQEATSRKSLLHKRGGVDLISLPRDFSRLRSTHMYDVVVKNREHFKVVDL
uniref:Uncharacterized protein n=1 Tax=Aegilops tauschii TaxID=37682 RepID=M8BRE2_AEGTA